MNDASLNPVISIKHFMLFKEIQPNPTSVQKWRDKIIEAISKTSVGGIQLTIANVVIFTNGEEATMLVSLANKENLTMRLNKFTSIVSTEREGVRIELMSNFEFQKKMMEALKDPSQKLEKDFLL